MEEQSHSPQTLPKGTHCFRCDRLIVGVVVEDGASCPECGLGIEYSMTRPLLRTEPIEYLERIILGMRWIEGGITGVISILHGYLLMLAAYFLAWLFVDFSEPNELVGVIQNIIDWFTQILFSLVLVCLLVQWRGLWLLSTPMTVRHPLFHKWRTWIRIGPGACFVMLVLTLLAQWVGDGPLVAGIFAFLTAVTIAAQWKFKRGLHALKFELDSRTSGSLSHEALKPTGLVGVLLRAIVVLALGYWVFVTPSGGLMFIAPVVLFVFQLSCAGCLQTLGLVRTEINAARPETA